ncbi:sialidase family protein [Persicitalea jodogahamensis]|uniref:Sialidase domain-containing protein n=1 Tax=Persicitalea jodogahamensis TaxID=402147 RepID=A0A8J3GB25_9BACT|nr:sialidase family protein [Persicitalea jodogahamensis]GHB74081.1 hypothetical protein GCM10007390_30460 [Persicitalea jodogahamensis]
MFILRTLKLHFSIRLIWLNLLLLPILASEDLHAQESLQQNSVLKLAPGEDNPRNSEGDFVTLKDGRILFVYSHYTGGSNSDHAPAYLTGRYSKDGGKTWTSEDKVIVEREGDMNVMSVSLLRMKNGKIALFYLRKNSTKDCIPMMRVSSDEAKTWSQPKPCIVDKKGYFVLNNSRVIQLKNGRILMPVALHTTADGQWQNKADLFTYYSDDNGTTWKSSQKVPDATEIVTQEPGVVALKDGRVMMYIRASGGVQQLSYSKDGGETWSAIEPSAIHSPLSPATIVRVPATGDLLLVWNNHKDIAEGPLKGKRTPLTVAISKDEGKTWQHINNIESNPEGWYCYIAVHFVGDHVLLGYCASDLSQNPKLSVTNITRLAQRGLYHSVD